MTDLPALYEEIREIVHPVTMGEVVRVESGGRVFAVNVNRKRGEAAPRVGQPQTLEEAVALATYWIGQGHTVDMGLGQVNSIHLPSMGLTVAQLFDERTNLRAAAAVLSACYARALRAGISAGDAALNGALSCYNTGDLVRGISIGYVSKYGVVPGPQRPMIVQASVSSPPRILPPRPVNPREAIAEAPPEWQAAVAMTIGALPP